MSEFLLDPRLNRDCLRLGRLPLCHVLLMNNRLVPWFILVPETDCTEILDLDSIDQASLLTEVNLIASFVRSRFGTDKLNVAAIGNVVQQLHLHVVGRYRDDYAWPGVVWGRSERESYPAHDVELISRDLGSVLGPGFESLDPPA